MIESSKNSQTEVQRERLKHLSKDFPSICKKGDIIYLGTPQSIDSIYNGLFSRGYKIRVWPGRYPTIEEEENYGEFLAPLIRKRMLEQPQLRSGGGPLGDRGQPTDPDLINEENLTNTEIDQGAAYFQLQHMLDTRLMDADRFPLNPSKIIFTTVPVSATPLAWYTSNSDEYRIRTAQDWPLDNQPLFKAAGHDPEFIKFQPTVLMYIDPAGGGQNGDETAYVVTKFAGEQIYVLDIGAVKGGLDEATVAQVLDVAETWGVNRIEAEKNFGNGAFLQVMRSVMSKRKKTIATEDVWESGQKELRIIDVLEPLLGAGRIVMDTSLIEKDWALCQRHPIADRPSFSMFYQMARITREREALIHDDRVDALASACRYWLPHIQKDMEREKVKAAAERYKLMMVDPMMTGMPVGPSHSKPATKSSGRMKLSFRS